MTNISVRIDENLKKDAETLFDDLGMSMSGAINIFFRQAVREQAIPFEIKKVVDPFYSERNMAILRQRAAEMDAGVNCSEHELIEVD